MAKVVLVIILIVLMTKCNGNGSSSMEKISSTSEIREEEKDIVEIGDVLYSALNAFFFEGYVDNWSFASGEKSNSLVFTLLNDFTLESGNTMKKGSNFYLWSGTETGDGSRGFDFSCSILLDSAVVEMNATGNSFSGSYNEKAISSVLIEKIVQRLLSIR